MSANPLLIGPASPADRAAAFRLVFQALDGDEVRGKARRAEQMIRRGELDADGIRLATDGTGPAAALIAAPVPGRAAVVWPPKCRVSHAHPDTVLDPLVADTIAWMRSRGIRMAQCTVPGDESPHAAPLVRGGFRHVTRLLYLRHFLDLSYSQMAAAERWPFRSYAEAGESAFAEVLARTHAGTLDCPEILGVRTPAEVLAGHRGAAEFDPERWWVAGDAGIVLLNATDPDVWDVAYLGVAPEARRRGLGSELTRKALFEAKAAGMTMLTLAVDTRNEPARALYRRAGFEPFDERDVFLLAL